MTVGQDQAGPLTSVMMTEEEVGAFVMMTETDMEEVGVSVMMIEGTGKTVGRKPGTERTAMRNTGNDVIIWIFELN